MVLLIAAIKAQEKKDQAGAVMLYEKALQLAEARWGTGNHIAKMIQQELNGIGEPPGDNN